MKDLLSSCHGHGLARGTIIQIFYHGLDDATQVIFDAGGIFLCKNPNEAYQLLKDRVLLKLDWSKDNKTKPLRKTVAFAEGSDNSKLIKKTEALTTNTDSKFKAIQGEIKEMRDGCNNCGGYRGGGYRINYYGRSSNNCYDSQRDDTRHSQPRDENRPSQQSIDMKHEESYFGKTMQEFMVAKKSSNDFVKNQFFNLKTKVEQGQKNYQAAIQDLKTKSRSTFQPAFCQTFCWHAQLWKFLKDLISKKSKIEQISAAFLNKECFVVVQNKFLSKLYDQGSFLIPYTLGNSVTCDAMADLGASINMMSYSLYSKLFVDTLKPTRMSIRLANHTYQYHVGVAENMLVQGLESVRYDISNVLDTKYWRFLGVGTAFDIFQNIHILYLQYSVLVFSGYGVLILFPSWSLVSGDTDTPYLP
ncbi:reverse transcriptase domain-containing protein [Tanacetum coccineum]